MGWLPEADARHYHCGYLRSPPRAAFSSTTGERHRRGRGEPQESSGFSRLLLHPSGAATTKPFRSLKPEPSETGGEGVCPCPGSGTGIGGMKRTKVGLAK